MEEETAVTEDVLATLNHLGGYFAETSRSLTDAINKLARDIRHKNSYGEEMVSQEIGEIIDRLGTVLGDLYFAVVAQYEDDDDDVCDECHACQCASSAASDETQEARSSGPEATIGVTSNDPEDTIIEISINGPTLKDILSVFGH